MRPSASGVGTAIRWYSAATGAAQTVRRPEPSASATSVPRPGSAMCGRPSASAARTRASVSTPTTRHPARAASTAAVGSPM